MEYRKLDFNDDLVANGFLNMFTMLKTKENEFELYSGEHGNIYVDIFGTIDEAKQEAEKINIQNIKSVHLAVSYWISNSVKQCFHRKRKRRINKTKN